MNNRATPGDGPVREKRSNVAVHIVRPLLAGMAISSLMFVLPPAQAARWIAILVLVLVPFSFWMAWLLLRAQHKHPDNELLGNQAEIAVVASMVVFLIGLTAVNYLLGGPRGLGFAPLATAVLMTGARPLWFLIGYYRGRW